MCSLPRRLRILVAVSTMGGGGAERQAALLLRHLDRRRFEPRGYLIQREGPLLDLLPDDVPLSVFAERHRSPSFYVPGAIHRQQIADLAQVLKQERIDVLYERMYFMSMIGGRAARYEPHVARVAVIDSNPARDLPATAGRFVWLKRRLLRHSYLAADRTLAVSEGVRQQSIHYYKLPESRIETCYNFLDLQRIDELAQHRAGTVAEALTSGAFHVLAIGRLQQEKGFDLLLAALADVVHRQQQPRVMLHLLGDGPARAALEQQSAELRLADHVRFHGYIKNPYPWLKAAQLFCLSSRYEGLPTVLLEAMHCGVPILATDCLCGPREILLDGQLGQLVPVNNIRALADGLRSALDDYPTWQARCAAAQAHVQQHFSLTAGMQRIEQILIRAAENRRDSG